MLYNQVEKGRENIKISFLIKSGASAHITLIPNQAA